jgi:effector-binding domain-containing protein
VEIKCEIHEQAPQPTLTIRTRTSAKNLPQAMGTAYGAIAQYMGELGEQPAGPPYCAYYNMDMEDLDVELGFAVDKVLAGKGEIQAGEMPIGMMASCLFTGPYVELAPAYDALASWIEENGMKATGVAYEFYLNDPTEVPPEELMTQIAFPLK